MWILRGHSEAVRCLSYSPDGRRLATGSEDTTVRLWDLTAGGALVGSLEHQASVEALLFSADGSQLFTGSGQGTLHVWDLASNRSRTSQEAHSEGVRCLIRSTQGDTVVTVGWDRSVKGWTRGLQECQPLTASPHVSMAAFAPGEPILAVGHLHGLIDLHHLHTREPVRTLTGDSSVEALAWSADDQHLASGHADGSVRLWGVSDEGVQVTLPGHSWTVYALAFTPDGGSLLSGGADGTVRHWDVAARSQRCCFRWHSRWVTCLAVAPDGMTAAAGSADATIVVWDVDGS